MPIPCRSGSNVHGFAFDAVESNIPYLTSRRMLEGQRRLGEVVQDNRIASMELTFPNAGPITAAIEMMGRVPSDAGRVRTSIPRPIGNWTVCLTRVTMVLSPRSMKLRWC